MSLSILLSLSSIGVFSFWNVGLGTFVGSNPDRVPVHYANVI